MRICISILLLSFFTLAAKAQIKNLTADTINPAEPVQVVDVACGQCQFGMPGKSCDLAVRINGKAYFVEGTGIDDHGDAHAKNGFCNSIRKAEIQGEIKNDKFAVTYFKLLDDKRVKKRKRS